MTSLRAASLPVRGDPYAELSALIVRGALAPGARVSEDTLAARLGVSRTPVREAMRRLQRDGLLVSDGGGARPRVAVAPLTGDEAREIYECVGAIEGQMTRSIALLPSRERTRLATELRDCDERFREVARARRRAPDRLFALHDAFHAQLRAACSARVALELLATLRPRLERYQWFQGPLVQMAGLTFAPTHAEHASIIAAVRTGSAEAIEHAVRANWHNAGTRFAAALEGAQGAVVTEASRRLSEGKTRRREDVTTGNEKAR